MRDPRSIVVTGASAGLGAALAREWSAPDVRLVLTGRNVERLSRVADDCRGRGADVEALVVDATDGARMRAELERVDDERPIDLVVANAGVSAGTGAGGENEDQARVVLATNIDGVLNTIHPLIPRMRDRGRGQIAIMSSLAGFRGFPGAPAYCASKAAVRLMGESLRGELAPLGVEVAVICPGFVRTPMTDRNPFPMPLLMDADRAARIIRRGLERNRGRIAFPFPVVLAVRLLAALPDAVADRLTRRAPKKPSGGV